MINHEIILPQYGLLMNQLSHIAVMSECIHCKLGCVWTDFFP